MEQIDMGVNLNAQQRRPQMAGFVRKDIKPRMPADQPPGQEIHGQREPVHLGEERHNKSGKGAKRPPITRRARSGETEREDDEDQGIDEDQGPQAVGGFASHLCVLPHGQRDDGPAPNPVGSVLHGGDACHA